MSRLLSDSDINMVSRRNEAIARLDITLASFDSPDFINNDLNTEQERQAHEDKIINSYLFLKEIGDENVDRYNNQLIKYYPHYLKYVVYREKLTGSNGERKFLRYNLIEAFFKHSGINPNVESLQELSANRRAISGGSSFFHFSSSDNHYFKKYCEAEWARIPLETLRAAGCIESTICERVKNIVKSRYSNAHDQNDLQQLEKLYYISELILQSQFKKANTEFMTLKLVWPEIAIDDLHDALEILKNEAIDEIAGNGELTGEKYRRFSGFLSSRLYNDLDSHVNAKVWSFERGIWLCGLFEKNKDISDSFELNKFLKKIMNGLLETPAELINIDSLRSLQNCVGKKIIWMGSRQSWREACSRLAVCDSKTVEAVWHAVRAIILKASLVEAFKNTDVKKPDILDLKLVNNISCAVFHIDFSKTELENILQNALSYSEIKQAAFAKEVGIKRFKETLLFFPDLHINNHSVNTDKLMALQNLQKLVVHHLRHMEDERSISAAFSGVINHLNQIAQQFRREGDGTNNFLDLIVETRTLAIQKQHEWREKLSLTFSTHSQCDATRQDHAAQLLSMSA